MYVLYIKSQLWLSCLLHTFPKLPLPRTLRNWKSSIVYFLNRGIVVAGGVTRPLLVSVLVGLWSSYGSRRNAELLLNAGVEATESVLLPLLHEGAVTGIKTTSNISSAELGSSCQVFLQKVKICEELFASTVLLQHGLCCCIFHKHIHKILATVNSAKMISCNKDFSESPLFL